MIRRHAPGNWTPRARAANVTAMSRAQTLLSVLDDAPVSTSDLYERVGYPRLVSLGLVPYHAFRAELAKLAKAGLVGCDTDSDGSSVWWRLAGPDGGSGDSPRFGIPNGH